MNTTSRAIVAFALLSFLLPWQPAHADVLNGGFEAGLAGWDAIGTADAATVVGVAAPQGAFQAVIRSSGVSELDIIDAALGAPIGTLATFDSHDPARASIVYQTVTVPAGYTLTFRWNFVTNEPRAGFDDFSFFSIGGVLFSLGDANSASTALPAASDFARQTGYMLVQIPFASATSFVLGFGVADEGAPSIESALLVDDVQVRGSVAEPSTLPLLVVALAAGVAVGRRAGRRPRAPGVARRR